MHKIPLESRHSEELQGPTTWTYPFGPDRLQTPPPGPDSPKNWDFTKGVAGTVSLPIFFRFLPFSSVFFRSFSFSSFFSFPCFSFFAVFFFDFFLLFPFSSVFFISSVSFKKTVRETPFAKPERIF